MKILFSAYISSENLDATPKNDKQVCSKHEVTHHDSVLTFPRISKIRKIQGS